MSESVFEELDVEVGYSQQTEHLLDIERNSHIESRKEVDQLYKVSETPEDAWEEVDQEKESKVDSHSSERRGREKLISLVDDLELKIRGVLKGRKSGLQIGRVSEIVLVEICEFVWGEYLNVKDLVSN